MLTDEGLLPADKGWDGLGADSPEPERGICRRLADRCRAQIIWFSSARELEKGAFLKDGRLMLATEEGRLITLCRREELKIIGLHNVENALASNEEWALRMVTLGV